MLVGGSCPQGIGEAWLQREKEGTPVLRGEIYGTARMLGSLPGLTLVLFCFYFILVILLL